MVNVRIEVVVDPSQAAAGSRRVRDELKKTEDSADKLRATIRRTFAGIGIGLLVRELTQAADAYTNLQNRIRTVTESEQELADVTAQIFQIANDTRSAFDATAEVYARTALAAKDLGISQQDTLAFTKSLNQAVALSGASAEEARAGLIQLSQGLASGALRGDELRSVLEQLPVVADVIAKSLGVTRGELREMGAEGKITADIILRAFEQAREELDERFGKSVPTIGQSFTVLRNNLVQTVGEFDQAVGASGVFAQLIVFIAENLDIAAGGVLVLAAAIATAYIPATVTATSLTTALIARIAALNVTAIASTAVFAGIAAAAAIAARRIGEEFEEAQQRITEATEAGEKFALTDYGKVGADILRVRENLAIVTAAITRSVAAGDQATEAQIALQQRYQAELDKLIGEQKRLADGTAQSAAEARKQTLAIEATATATGKSIASIQEENKLLRLSSREREIQAALLQEVARIEKDKDNAKVTDTQREQLELALRENQALQDRADALDQVFGPAEKFEAQVRALNQALQEGAITQDQFDTAVAELAKSLEGADLSKLNLEGIDLSGLDGGGLDALLEKISKLGQAEQKQLDIVKQTIAEYDARIALAQRELELRQQGNADAAGQAQFEQEFAQAIAVGNVALAARILALDQLRQQTEAQDAAEQLLAETERNRKQIVDSFLAPQEQLLATQLTLNQLLAEGTINAQQYAIAMGNAKLQVDGLGRTAAEGAAAGLQQIENELVDVGATVQETLVNGFHSAEDALVGFLRTGEFDFKKFIDSILDDLARLLVQQGLLALLGGPGAAQGAGFFGNFFGGNRADGGGVEAGRSYMVGEHGKPELFTPESAGRVLSASQTQRAMQPIVNVTAPPAQVTIVNATDPGEFSRYLSTSEGEEAVLNVVRRNPRAVQAAR